MQFAFYSRKEEGLEIVVLEPTGEGWYMMHHCYQGSVDPSGKPHLQQCIEENYSPYPSCFGDALEEIWEAIQTKRITNREVQSRLSKFSYWLQAYEKNPTLRLADIH